MLSLERSFETNKQGLQVFEPSDVSRLYSHSSTFFRAVEVNIEHICKNFIASKTLT